MPIPPPGVTPALRWTLQRLRQVFGESDQEARVEAYRQVLTHLREVEHEVENLDGWLAEQAPPPEECRPIDEHFHQAADCFRSALDSFAAFLEDEVPGLLDEAETWVEKGAGHLEQAEAARLSLGPKLRLEAEL